MATQNCHDFFIICNIQSFIRLMILFLYFLSVPPVQVTNQRWDGSLILHIYNHLQQSAQHLRFLLLHQQTSLPIISILLLSNHQTLFCNTLIRHTSNSFRGTQHLNLCLTLRDLYPYPRGPFRGRLHTIQDTTLITKMEIMFRWGRIIRVMGMGLGNQHRGKVG